MIDAHILNKFMSFEGCFGRVKRVTITCCVYYFYSAFGGWLPNNTFIQFC